MTLKEQMAADIDDVFLNTDDMAETHSIDGVDIVCILENDKSSKNSLDGVYVIRRQLFVKESDLGYKPEPEQKMKIDDTYFYVVDCIDDGLLEVTLEQRQS